MIDIRRQIVFFFIFLKLFFKCFNNFLVSRLTFSLIFVHYYYALLTSVTFTNLLLHARLLLLFNKLYVNKCIGDDTKAAARQSLNCIKTNKIKYGEKQFSICLMEFLHPAMWQDDNIDFVR